MSKILRAVWTQTGKVLAVHDPEWTSDISTPPSRQKPAFLVFLTTCFSDHYPKITQDVILCGNTC